MSSFLILIGSLLYMAFIIRSIKSPMYIRDTDLFLLTFEFLYLKFYEKM